MQICGCEIGIQLKTSQQSHSNHSHKRLVLIEPSLNFTPGLQSVFCTDQLLCNLSERLIHENPEWCMYKF